jgi:hypothetical protein
MNKEGLLQPKIALTGRINPVKTTFVTLRPFLATFIALHERCGESRKRIL